MSFRHFNLTLDGTVQRLSNALPDNTVGGADDEALRVISLQPEGGNADPIFVGGGRKAAAGASLSSTDYGFRLEAATATIPPAPFILGEFETGPIRLSEFYVLGTADEILHIAVLGY